MTTRQCLHCGSSTQNAKFCDRTCSNRHHASLPRRKVWHGWQSTPEQLARGVKSCKTCGCEKPIAEFWIRGGEYPAASCRACTHEARKAYAKEKGLKYRNRLLTPEQHDALMAKQNGKCALCLVRDAQCVDHCHDTGRVRGLLCQPCNMGLGRLGDTPASIERALLYVRGEL